jgi:TPR repeat protein
MAGVSVVSRAGFHATRRRKRLAMIDAERDSGAEGSVGPTAQQQGRRKRSIVPALIRLAAVALAYFLVQFTNAPTRLFRYAVELGADIGFAPAENSLGDLYKFGDGRGIDFEAAATWYRKAAYKGHAGAQYSLGLMYQAGLGVKRDYALAAEWYGRAADQRDARAQFELAGLYEAGRGVPKDAARAAAWYLKAADQGLPDAQFSLGLLYETGRGVPKDADRAVAWYEKAAANGSEEARDSVNRLQQK